MREKEKAFTLQKERERESATDFSFCFKFFSFRILSFYISSAQKKKFSPSFFLTLKIRI